MRAGGSGDPAVERGLQMLRDLREFESDGPMIAPASERFVARLIDTVFAFLVLVLVGFAGSALTYAIDGPPDRDLADPFGTQTTEHTAEIGWAATAVAAVVVLVNEVVLPARTGASIGKRRLHTWLVDAKTGGRISLRQAAVRFAVWPAPTFALLIAWAATMLTFTGLLALLAALAATAIPATLVRGTDGRGIHDRIAGTMVLAQRR